jgi:hypothetical protein
MITITKLLTISDVLELEPLISYLHDMRYLIHGRASWWPHVSAIESERPNAVVGLQASQNSEFVTSQAQRHPYAGLRYWISIISQLFDTIDSYHEISLICDTTVAFVYEVY